MVQKKQLKAYAERVVGVLDKAVSPFMRKTIVANILDLGKTCPARVVVFVIAGKELVGKREVVEYAKQRVKLDFVMDEMRDQLSGDPEGYIHPHCSVRLLCGDVMYVMKPARAELWSGEEAERDAEETLRTSIAANMEKMQDDQRGPSWGRLQA